MRVAPNGLRTHFILCALFTWGVTACVSEVAPTQSRGYDVLSAQRAVATGSAAALVRGADGQVLLDGPLDARAKLNERLAARGRSLTAADSSLSRALTMTLLGIGSARTMTPVTFSYGDRTLTLAVQSRAADGRATAFALSMGDTTLTLTPVAGNSAEHRLKLTEGSRTLAQSSATLEYTTLAAAAQEDEEWFPGEDVDEGLCLEHLVVGALELTAAIVGLIDGMANLDLITVLASTILLLTSFANFYIFIVDCPRTIERWLRENYQRIWHDICHGFIILSWTPICGEE